MCIYYQSADINDNPTNFNFFSPFIILGHFWHLSLRNAYKCAKAFNRDNNFEKKTTFGKVVLLILAIIVYNVFVPSFGPFIKAYVRKNIVQPFKFPSDSMYPTIQREIGFSQINQYIKNLNLTEGT